MASTKAKAGDDRAFPPANPAQELNREKPDEFPVDPISTDVSTAKQCKEEAEARPRSGAAAEAEKSDLGSRLMSVLMISGVVIAAAGVAFLVTKKLKQT
ncbi:unnamed protein product [Musa acuminata subsp. malaccensis]|uniref:(wild Malaysian banana) hypothetical protein n=1 Tax=Musa acuminata subsp. malaccensis TaxID=214687 RepID=A0A804HSG0_MUSAM|nr:PREDICTED: uncharacterized protein LOC103983622 [Musa acuminata subsp. malaccensis]CAG1859114.1 unnamed protein product [Musa acuminata subsp. malaccensis]